MFMRVVLITLATFLVLPGAGTAQEKAKTASKFKDAASCSEFAPVAKNVRGQKVGVEQCFIVSEETVFNIKGQKFRRVEVRLRLLRLGAREPALEDVPRQRHGRVPVPHQRIEREAVVGDAGRDAQRRRQAVEQVRTRADAVAHRGRGPEVQANAEGVV